MRALIEALPLEPAAPLSSRIPLAIFDPAQDVIKDELCGQDEQIRSKDQTDTSCKSSEKS